MKKVFAVLTMVLMMVGAVAQANAQGRQNKAASDARSTIIEVKTKAIEADIKFIENDIKLLKFAKGSQDKKTFNVLSRSMEADIMVMEADIKSLMKFAKGSQDKKVSDVLSKAMETQTKAKMMLNDARDYFNNLPPIPVEDYVKAVKKAYPESAAAAQITVDGADDTADAMEVDPKIIEAREEAWKKLRAASILNKAVTEELKKLSMMVGPDAQSSQYKEALDALKKLLMMLNSDVCQNNVTSIALSDIIKAEIKALEAKITADATAE